MTRFQKLSIATTASTVLLVAAGGLVRATGSGLGCPGWPTCFGRWIPPLEAHAIIEYSHRLLATIAVVLIVVQAFVAWREYRTVRQIFRPSIAAVVLVFVQAALGGIVVKGELDAALVTLHFATAMALLGVLVNITSNSFCFVKLPLKGPAIAGSDPSFARLTLWAAGATFVLLIVGTYVRAEGVGLAFRDWPLMDGRLVPTLGGIDTLMFVHRLLAAAVLLLVIWLAIRARTMVNRSRDLVVLSTI
ncbi:MAG TPA: COX15/CtaA family protein, partial [Actinomycetota bacterium]|nr:COX15/CtaA family protein [Actinomycetota bacterium]